MIPTGWWELVQVAEQLGISRVNDCSRLARRCIYDNLIEPNEYMRRPPQISAGPGRRRERVYFSPVAVSVMAAQTNTPEAKAMVRETAREAAEKQLLGLEPTSSLVLPAPTPLSLEALAARIERLEQQAAKAEQVEVRVEKLEARVPEQLALPGIAPKVPWRNSFGLDFTAVLEGLREVSESERCQKLGRGMRAREVVALLEARNPSTEKLQMALGLPEGGTIDSSKLGYLLRSMSKAGQTGLTAHLDHRGVALWFVASDATH